MANKDDIIAKLLLTVEQLKKQIDRQAKQINAQEKQIDDLKLKLARAQKDSSNSSKSPSSDIVKPPKNNKNNSAKQKKRKRGAQKGHKRNLREPLPPERVDKEIIYDINDADVQKLGLIPTNEFEIIQHVELLDMPIYVTEHRLRKYLNCDGKVFFPDVPKVVNQPIFGSRLLSMIGWLKSRAHCSYTTVATWMSDVLQVPVSRGYLSKLCNGVISNSLADVHNELQQAIPQQPQLGSDESSLKNNGKKHWIWCITAPLFTLFHVATSRSRAVLEELIGTDYKGFMHCDYFSSNCSFAWNFDVKAQYCWAHLIRDIIFLEKHPDKKTNQWGEKLLAQSRRMFSSWHRREAMSEKGFRRTMTGHRNRFLEIIRKPPDSNEAGNLADRFSMVELVDGSYYDMSQDYFRFMFAANVEPTNNHSEQQIRHCVIDRKITQGTRSDIGQRYHERMWTAISTCGKQGRSFFNFLHASITASLTKQTPPTLLPE